MNRKYQAIGVAIAVLILCGSCGDRKSPDPAVDSQAFVGTWAYTADESGSDPGPERHVVVTRNADGSFVGKELNMDTFLRTYSQGEFSGTWKLAGNKLTYSYTSGGNSSFILKSQTGEAIVWTEVADVPYPMDITETKSSPDTSVPSVPEGFLAEGND